MAYERLSRLRLGAKRLIKTVLGPFGLPLAWASRAAGPRVLLYHRVNDYPFDELGPVSRELRVLPEDFAWQLRHLRARGWRPLSAVAFAEMIAGHRPVDPRAVLITFDDGYEDNLVFAAPLLRDAEMPALLFVATGFTGSRSGEIWPHGDAPEFGRFLTTAQVAEISTQGIAIGSHTVSHPRMTTQPDDVLLAELAESRAVLQAVVPGVTAAFAYPEGDVDDRVETLVRRAGYDLAFTTVTGGITRGANPFRLRRTEVSASDSRFIFALKMTGALDWTRIKDSAGVRGVVSRVNDALLSRVRAVR